MPKIVFVAGLRETGFKTVVDMVLEGSRSRLQKHLRLGFDDREIKKIRGMIPADTKKAATGIYNKIEKHISAAIKANSSVVVEGPITVKTEDGYLPLFPKKFFESFTPDVFILFEAAKGPDIDLTQQEVNRSYAELYASSSESPLKIIKISSGSVKSALKEFTHVVESIIGS